MGFIQFPTTADVGVFSFSPTFEELIDQSAKRMMSILSPKLFPPDDNQKLRQGQWSSTFDGHIDKEMILLRWLDEMLFRREIQNQWYLDGKISIQHTNDGCKIFADVVFIDSNEIVPETEIKAVTSHDNFVRYLNANESFFHVDKNIPEIAGPAWISQVIFDV
ncbi:MAG: archease [archaeon]|nr:archease [archaeon]